MAWTFASFIGPYADLLGISKHQEDYLIPVLWRALNRPFRIETMLSLISLLANSLALQRTRTRTLGRPYTSLVREDAV